MFAWNVPAGQFTQPVEPIELWYVPAAQLEQLVAAAAEYDPVEQEVHTLVADAAA